MTKDSLIELLESKAEKWMDTNQPREIIGTPKKGFNSIHKIDFYPRQLSYTHREVTEIELVAENGGLLTPIDTSTRKDYKLLVEARAFCIAESKKPNKDLFGVTDGKAVGTHIEHKFQQRLAEKYELTLGSSAKGIDLPSLNIDIKVTSIKQPQSSCPFKDAKQKIFGLGYNLLVFVYEKVDDPKTKTANLDFVSCSFISKERTAEIGRAHV